MNERETLKINDSGHLEIGGADCVALAKSLSVLPTLKFQLSGLTSQAVLDIIAGLPDMKELVDLLVAAIDANPPALMKDGQVLRRGAAACRMEGGMRA